MCRPCDGRGQSSSAIEKECREKGTTLCVLVVGPVDTYAARNGGSPLGRIMSKWGMDVPVIDVAIKALATRERRDLTFPLDGHLTEAGHEFVARGCFGADNFAEARHTNQSR